MQVVGSFDCVLGFGTVGWVPDEFCAFFYEFFRPPVMCVLGLCFIVTGLGLGFVDEEQGFWTNYDEVWIEKAKRVEQAVTLFGLIGSTLDN